MLKFVVILNLLNDINCTNIQGSQPALHRLQHWFKFFSRTNINPNESNLDQIRIKNKSKSIQSPVIQSQMFFDYNVQINKLFRPSFNHF